MVGWCVNRVMRRFDWSLRSGARHGMLLGLLAAASCVVVLGLIVWPNWQNDQRDLMGMEHISATALVPMVLATLVLTVIVVWLGRIVWRGVRAVDRWVSRHFQRTGAVIATNDVSLATDIARHDEEMDRLHRELFTIVLSPTWSHGVEAAIDVTLLSRYYERYADHAVSVTKRVVTIVTGEPYVGVSLEG